MTKKKSQAEKAAGKLISSIQKGWNDELGQYRATKREIVMGRAHVLLQARTADRMVQILEGKSVSDYLGGRWLLDNEEVMPYIVALENALKDEHSSNL